jgi:hypothetical protein
VAAGADKGFFDIGFVHAQRGHALGKLGLLFRADRECAHVVPPFTAPLQTQIPSNTPFRESSG